MIGFFATVLVVLTGALGGVARPTLGCACYYWLAILRPELLWFWVFASAGNSFSKMVAAGALVGWLMNGGPNALSELGRAATPLKGLLVFLLSGALGTYLWAVNPAVAEDNLMIQLKIAVMAAAAVTTTRGLRDVWLTVALVLFGLGFLAWELNLAWVQTYRIPSYILSMHGDNNNFSLLMVVLVPLGLSVAIASERLWIKGLAVVAALMGLHAILFLESRGAYLATAAVLASYFLWAVSSPGMAKYGWWGLILGVCFVGMFAGERVVDEWETIFASEEDRDASAQSRVDLLKVGVNVITTNPLGLGPRQTPQVMEQYDFPKGKLLHNLYAQVGADYGVFGLAGYLTYFLGALRCAFLTSRRPVGDESDRQLNALAFGLGVGLVGFLVAGVFLSCDRIEIGVIAASMALAVDRAARLRSAAAPDHGLDPEPMADPDGSLEIRGSSI